MTLAEAHRSAFEAERAHPEHALPNRFAVEAMVSRFASGGLPVPLFTRDEGLVSAYFQSWVETSILRDARRAYGDGYNPDVAFSILTQMTTALKNGEYASLKHFKQNSRQARRYLSALEDIFLLHRLSPHEDTVGSDLWTFFDTGVLSYFARGVIGEALRISLSRISVLNEIRATCEYAGRRMRPVYYKTARGAPVDLLWEDTLIKISSAPRSQVEYDLRPLRSAMKKLDIKKGFLLWGFDQNAHDDLVGFGKIKMVPWTHYS
jgi:predicted AAA+ superfamily ATPase